MKRVLLALLGLFCAANLCIAQVWQGRVMRGTATQEMQNPGLTAAHANIPVGAKVKVTNPANGIEIEATIVQQIAESYNRIIDLSPSAALALGLGTGGPVLVTTLALPPVIGATPPPPVVTAVAPPPDSEPEPEKPQQPFNIIINNYLLEPGKDAELGLSDEKAPAEPVKAVVPPTVSPPAPIVPVPPVPVTPPVYSSLYSGPPVPNIQIIPGLPSPNTNKVYRLLVGTYQGLDGAYIIHQQLQAAGFDVVQEQAGEACRVYAVGIPASQVYYAAQRLGAIGFQQVWIQE